MAAQALAGGCNMDMDKLDNNLTIHRQHRPGEEAVPLPRPVLAVTELYILATDSVPGAGVPPARSLGRRENVQYYKFF